MWWSGSCGGDVGQQRIMSHVVAPLWLWAGWAKCWEARLISLTSYGVRMNEPGFHGLVSHGWMETAAQAVKCGAKAFGCQ